MKIKSYLIVGVIERQKLLFGEIVMRILKG